MVEGEISLKVRQKISSGALPCEECRKVWASPGTDRPCHACDLAISQTDIEFECELFGGYALVFHRACLRLWEEECQRQGAPGQKY